MEEGKHGFQSYLETLEIFFEALERRVKNSGPRKMLTHFTPLVSFYTPWKYQKNSGI